MADDHTDDQLVDLAARELGGGVVAVNDEFFAAADHLLGPEPPVFDPHSYGSRGKVMDGWETRRRRAAGRDWALVRLGAPGVVHTVVIDTRHFTGNYPPAASVEGCGVEGHPDPVELASADWFPLVDRVALRGDTVHRLTARTAPRCTHVRLTIHPDGGVARLRVLGSVVPDPRRLDRVTVDLAALEHGGLVVGCSDSYFSDPLHLLGPGRPAGMADGWETRRRRDDGNDWALIRLAGRSRVRHVEIDTTHFKGNAPGAARLLGADRSGATPPDSPERGDPAGWSQLLPRTRLQPDTRHWFRVADDRPATHVRLDIFPDGGVARLRVVGTLDPVGRGHLGLRWFNTLPAAQLHAVLTETGLAPAAATDLAEGRPYPDLESLTGRASARVDSHDTISVRLAGLIVGTP